MAQPPCLVKRAGAIYIGRMNLSLPYLNRLLPLIGIGPVVAVIRLSGMIGASGRATLNDVALAPLIERAFRSGKPAAVALLINSPGGSPVQSSLTAARIRRLAEEKTGVPLVHFDGAGGDVAGGGGTAAAVPQPGTFLAV